MGTPFEREKGKDEVLIFPAGLESIPARDKNGVVG